MEPVKPDQPQPSNKPQVPPVGEQPPSVLPWQHRILPPFLRRGQQPQQSISGSQGEIGQPELPQASMPVESVFPQSQQPQEGIVPTQIAGGADPGIQPGMQEESIAVPASDAVSIQPPSLESATISPAETNVAEPKEPIASNNPAQPASANLTASEIGYKASQEEYTPGDPEKAAALAAVHDIVNEARTGGINQAPQPSLEAQRDQSPQIVSGEGGHEESGILELLAKETDYKEAYRLLEIVKGFSLNDALPVLTQFVGENHSEAGAITINHSVLVLRHVLSNQRAKDNDRLNLTPGQQKEVETFFSELSRSPLLEDPMLICRVSDEVKLLLDINSEIINVQQPFIERALLHDSQQAISAGVRLIDSLPLDDALLVATKFATENHSRAATMAATNVAGALTRILWDRRQNSHGSLNLTAEQEQGFSRYFNTLSDITVPVLQQLPQDDRAESVKQFAGQIAFLLVQNPELDPIGQDLARKLI